MPDWYPVRIAAREAMIPPWILVEGDPPYATEYWLPRLVLARSAETEAEAELLKLKSKGIKA